MRRLDALAQCRLYRFESMVPSAVYLLVCISLAVQHHCGLSRQCAVHRLHWVSYPWCASRPARAVSRRPERKIPTAPLPARSRAIHHPVHTVHLSLPSLIYSRILARACANLRRYLSDIPGIVVRANFAPIFYTCEFTGF